MDKISNTVQFASHLLFVIVCLIFIIYLCIYFFFTFKLLQSEQTGLDRKGKDKDEKLRKGSFRKENSAQCVFRLNI